MDTPKLLRSLNEHRARFIEPTKENAERVHAALRDFGYDVTDLTIDDLLSKKILIRQDVLQTDIHPFVKGAAFEQVWKGRISGAIDGVPTFFAGLDDLIERKRAANRPKDREDLRVLEEIRKRAK
jgi:hypothetical protein